MSAIFTSADDSTLNVNMVYGPISNSQGPNCISYDRGSMWGINNGSVQVEWETDDPLAQELELHYRDFLTETRDHVSGPSPLRLLIPNMSIEDHLNLYVEPTIEPGFIDMSVRFVWHIEYTGAPEADYTTNASC